MPLEKTMCCEPPREPERLGEKAMQLNEVLREINDIAKKINSIAFNCDGVDSVKAEPSCLMELMCIGLENAKIIRENLFNVVSNL